MASIDIYNILKEFDIASDASDTVVRSTLEAHGWDMQDIDALLRVRAGVDTTMTHTRSLHKLLAVDHQLHPATIASVMKVSFTIDALQELDDPHWYSFSLRTVITIMATGCVGALFVVGIVMWWYDLGVFHPLA